MTSPLPARPEDIGDRWFGHVLADAGLVPPGCRVTTTTERIGADRGFTGAIARVRWSLHDGTHAGSLIVKLPDAEHDFERCAREVRFYRALGPRLGRAVPRAHWCAADPEARRVVIVLEDVPGRDGDAAVASSATDIDATVRAIAAVHAAWWRDPRLAALDWLPPWGRGTARAAAPHRRRADRFRKQGRAFLAHHIGNDDRADIRDVLDRAGTDLEPRLARIAALPATLVHADLHADNLVFRRPAGSPRPDDVVLLDWQSVSHGPAAYDVTRFVVGAIDADRPLDAVRRHVETHAAALRDAGVPAADAHDQTAATDDMVIGLFVGFVSGYGGRAPHAMTARERRLVARALSPRGLLGATRAVLDAPPPR